MRVYCAASSSACAAGPGAVPNRRYHPQFVSPLRHGPGAATVRTAGRVADAAFAAARRRLYLGLGFDRLRTLWPAGGIAERTQPAQG